MHLTIEINITISKKKNLIIAVLSLSIPDLDDLTTSVGALASSALLLVFHLLVHILTLWKQPYCFLYPGCFESSKMFLLDCLW